MAKRQSGRAVIFGAAFVVVFTTSGPSAFSVFADPLIAATGGSRSQVVLALTLYQFCMAVTGIFSGRIMDRSGPRLITYAGALLMGLGWMLTALAADLTRLYLGFGLTLGVGVGLIYAPAINLVVRWYPDKRGAMSGALLSAASLGPLVLARAGAGLHEHFGLFALVYVGCVCLSLVWLVAWTMRLPPPGWLPEGWTPPAAPPRETAPCTPGMMIRSGLFWLMLALYSLAATAGVMMVSSLSPIAQVQLGLSAVAAAGLVSLNCLANFAGRLGFGRLCDLWGESRTLVLLYALTIIGLAGMSACASVPVFAVFLVLLGGAFGGVLVVFPPLTAKAFGITYSGSNYGLMFFGYAVGSLLGPQIAAGAANPAAGARAFASAYHVAACVALAGLFLNILLIRLERRGKRGADGKIAAASVPAAGSAATD